MANELKLSTHTVNETRKVVYDLTDKIASKYPRIGQNQGMVYIEVIRIEPKKANDFMYTILAGEYEFLKHLKDPLLFRHSLG